MTVRSALLALHGISASTDDVTYVSPALVITLVKTIVFTNNGAASATAFCYAKQALTGNAARVTPLFTVPNNDAADIETWLVLEPGDELHTVTGGQPFNVYVAGAQLVN